MSRCDAPPQRKNKIVDLALPVRPSLEFSRCSARIRERPDPGKAANPVAEAVNIVRRDTACRIIIVFLNAVGGRAYADFLGDDYNIGYGVDCNVITWVAEAGLSGAKEAPGFRAALSNPGHPSTTPDFLR